MAQSLSHAARWAAVVAATIALVVAFSLPGAIAKSSSSDGESVVARRGRHHCGARRVYRHRDRGYRHHGGCGTASYGGCGTSYSSQGGCTIGGGCY
ncbi:MAG: hypothetical protein ACIALR_05345 [Blastopirellula sp. JB062]